MKRTKTTLIQVYAPTESSINIKLENFYELLLESMLHKYKSQRTIVMGDFNSKEGWQEHRETETVWPYGYGKRNSRGERMVQFAQENRMKILNTFFRKHPSKRWTWWSPDGIMQNEIDYILTNDINDVSDIHVVQNIKFSTNHRMVRATIKSRKRFTYHNKKTNQPAEQLHKNSFIKHLQNHLHQQSFNPTREVRFIYNSLKKVLLTASTNCLRKEKRKLLDKLSQQTIDLIKQREWLQHNRYNSEKN